MEQETWPEWAERFWNCGVTVLLILTVYLVVNLVTGYDEEDCFTDTCVEDVVDERDTVELVYMKEV